MLGLAACSGRAGPATESGPGGPRTDAPPSPTGKSAEADTASEAAADPAQPAPPAHLAESGLAVGEHFEPFEVHDPSAGESFCMVCEPATSPKIVAAGVLGDAEFEEDIKDIDAIVAKWGRDRVTAFAVVGVLENGTLVTPTRGGEEFVGRAGQLRDQLDVSIPVVIPVAGPDGPDAIWNERYHVTRSRTIMLADGDDEVKYSAIAPEHLGPLDAAIRAALGS